MTVKHQSPDPPLPANITAERAILGAILLDNVVWEECAKSLKPEDFSVSFHQRIFTRMGELILKGINVDTVTMMDSYFQDPTIQIVDGGAYIVDLLIGLPRRLAMTDYIRIVKEKSRLRSLMKICEKHLDNAWSQQSEAKEIGRAMITEVKEVFK